MTTVAHDILARVQAAGATLTLKQDGGIKARNIPVDLLAEVRAHKAEILELLKIESPKTFSRLELAQDALAKLVPDAQAQRRIMAIAQADAKNWRFWGTETYQHVLAGNIMDQVEVATGKLICFQGTHAQDRFGGWFMREIQP